MKLLKRFFAEDSGAEVTEYALVLGLVALAAIGGLTSAGGALTAWWSNLAAYVATIPINPP